MPSRALICEDALGYRLLLARLLEEAGLDVVGEGVDWDEAERLAAQLQPDLVVVDLWMPQLDTDALARVRQAASGAVLVALSGLSVDEAQLAVGEAATIDLFLSKRQPPAEIVDAVREALSERGPSGRPGG